MWRWIFRHKTNSMKPRSAHFECTEGRWWNSIVHNKGIVLYSQGKTEKRHKLIFGDYQPLVWGWTLLFYLVFINICLLYMMVTYTLGNTYMCLTHFNSFYFLSSAPPSASILRFSLHLQKIYFPTSYYISYVLFFKLITLWVSHIKENLRYLNLCMIYFT